MLLIRLFALLALLCIGGSLVAWILTGNALYRQRAWLFFRIGVVALAVVLVLFAIERILSGGGS